MSAAHRLLNKTTESLRARWADAWEARLLLTGLTIAKIMAFVILQHYSLLHPFIGDNARQYYIPIAQRLALQNSFNDTTTRDDSSVPPGYPFLLSLMDRVVGSAALSATVLFQMLVDLFIACCLLRLGIRMGNTRVGAAAAIIWLLFPPALSISTWITPETLYAGFVIGGLMLIARRNPTVRTAISSGLVLGVATLIRGNTLLLPFVLFPYWVLQRAHRRALAFTLAFCIPLAVWTIRNYVVLGDPIVSSTSFGSAFLQGSDERYYHEKSGYPALFAAAAADGLSKPAVETGSNINHWLFVIGVRNYRLRLQNDGFFAAAGQLLRKPGYMWFLTESGNTRSQIFLLVCSLLVVPLGLWELWIWLRSGDGSRSVLAITVGFWIAIHVLVVPIARYVVPILPIVVFAACFRSAGLLTRAGLLPLRNKI